MKLSDGLAGVTGCQAFVTGDVELARARGELKILVLAQLTV